MLLLSSATRILATKLPPDILHPCLAYRPLCDRFKLSTDLRPTDLQDSTVLEHPAYCASIFSLYLCVGNEYALLAASWKLSLPKKEGCSPGCTPPSHPGYLLVQTT